MEKIESLCGTELRKTGMNINEQKCECLNFHNAKPQKETKWRNVEIARMLGVYLKRDGSISWSTLTDKLTDKMESLSACIRSATIAHKIRIANSYGFSILVHTLRIATPEQAIITKWYTNVQSQNICGKKYVKQK